PIAMDSQLRFAIREGGRTVGSGVVTEIIEESLFLYSSTRILSSKGLLRGTCCQRFGRTGLLEL
ncbi:MAG TPA: hypothetical protein EYQ69_04350, partial [Gemmatimonadetes bacterium]|nr:hypothetical protein [Gemmatimonadota bacterium]